MKLLWTAALTSFLFMSPAIAQVSVSAPWVRATVAEQKATGAFMKLTATDATRLIEAKSPVAGSVEIHEMTMDNNIMKMRAITGLDIPQGASVELKPGGYHVMLLDLKQTLKEGATVPITLVFEDKDKKQTSMQIDAPVKSLTTPAHKH